LVASLASSSYHSEDGDSFLDALSDELGDGKLMDMLGEAVSHHVAHKNHHLHEWAEELQNELSGEEEQDQEHLPLVPAANSVAEAMHENGYGQRDLKQLSAVLRTMDTTDTLGESLGVSKCSTPKCAKLLRDRIAKTTVQVSKLKGAKAALSGAQLGDSLSEENDVENDDFVSSLHSALGSAADMLGEAAGSDVAAQNKHLTSHIAKLQGKLAKKKASKMLKILSAQKQLGESVRATCGLKKCIKHITSQVAKTSIEMKKLRGARKELKNLAASKPMLAKDAKKEAKKESNKK